MILAMPSSCNLASPNPLQVKSASCADAIASARIRKKNMFWGNMAWVLTSLAFYNMRDSSSAYDINSMEVPLVSHAGHFMHHKCSESRERSEGRMGWPEVFGCNMVGHIPD